MLNVELQITHLIVKSICNKALNMIVVSYDKDDVVQKIQKHVFGGLTFMAKKLSIYFVGLKLTL